MIRKIQSIHLYYFHAWLNKLTWCLMQNKVKHFKGPCMSLKFESLVQIGSNPSGLSCISPTHSYCHVSCMHHIVAHCLVMVVYRRSLRQVLPPRSTVTFAWSLPSTCRVQTLSGGNMYEEVHPCRVNMIYSNSRVHGKGLLGCLYSS